MLAAMLKDFPMKIQKDIANASVAAGASIVRKRTRANIKSRGLVKAGNLLKSIKLRKRRDRQGFYYIYADGKLARHAHLSEFGTAPRRLKKPVVIFDNGQFYTIRQTGSVPATPFMRPALEENKSEVMVAMHRKMKQRMEKEVQKMSRSYRTLSKSYRRKLAT